MVLHTEHRLGFVPQSLDCLIIQIDFIHFDIGPHGRCIQRESVILRRDFDQSCVEVLDRLVAASLSEFHLKRGSTHRLA